MPPSEQERADALQRALEGKPSLTEASAPGAVPGALLATARALGAIESGDGLPSPTFVLGLEEQLRTDLRLGLAQAPGQELDGPPPGDRWQRVGPRAWFLLAVLLFGAVLLGTTWNAGPYHPLYQARLRLDAVRWSLAGLLGSGDEGTMQFAQGRRLLEDARVVVERPSIDAERLQRILSGLPAIYAVGTERASAAPDEWPLMRARIEVEAAATELERLAAAAPPAERAALEHTREALSGLMDPNRPGPVTVVVTAVPTDAPTEIATELAPPATATPTRTAANTQAPPASPPPTAALPPATPTTTATFTPTSAPPPERPQPTQTSKPVDPTGTPGDARPSPTRDAWPTSTPGQPGPTAPTVPTAEPTEQVRPPIPPPQP